MLPKPKGFKKIGGRYDKSMLLDPKKCELNRFRINLKTITSMLFEKYYNSDFSF